MTPEKRRQLEQEMKTIRPRLAQLARNGRWGTCGDCPCAGDGTILPELCANTRRSDHTLTAKDLFEQWERFGLNEYQFKDFQF